MSSPTLRRRIASCASCTKSSAIDVFVSQTSSVVVSRSRESPWDGRSLARSNPRWGYTRLCGALRNLCHEIGRNTIKRILKEHGLEPALSLVILSAALGLLYEISPLQTRDVLLHDHDHEHGVLAWLGLAALGGLTAVSLLRQGVRGFAGQILRLSHHRFETRKELCR
jgi:hypothetical protein